MYINPEYDEDNLKGKSPVGIEAVVLPSIPVNPSKKIHSPEHELAGKLCEYFNEKKFGMWLGIIKRKGIQNVYQAFAEVRQSKAKTPAKLLMWKLKNKTK